MSVPVWAPASVRSECDVLGGCYLAPHVDVLFSVY